jgi:hypothetical protein
VKGKEERKSAMETERVGRGMGSEKRVGGGKRRTRKEWNREHKWREGTRVHGGRANGEEREVGALGVGYVRA